MATSDGDRRVALVTGASRGIGKAVAVALAGAGFDVAVTARTVEEGEAREHSSTIQRSDTSPLPGSLGATAAAIEATGQRALPVAADLLDFASVGAAVATVLERWGRVDVVVNNGRYVGPGHMDHFLDTPVEIIERHLAANVIAPLHVLRLVLPGMLERGSGTLVTMTSGAGTSDPPGPAGSGGWGLGYAVSKGAVQRVLGVLAVEHPDRGLRFFNVQPGPILTERIKADMGEFGFGGPGWAPPELIGAVVTWLATADEAAGLPIDVEAQPLAAERGLYEWSSAG
ncbi:MAG TPA: SDR family oxidoreductase [Acidimicrobiales bacterium]|nr:SDR family oxidoreductase [Acidimicrobiales bacterium]